MNALRVNEVNESESLRSEFVIRSLLNSKFHFLLIVDTIEIALCFYLQFTRRFFAIYISYYQLDFQHQGILAGMKVMEKTMMFWFN